MALRSLCAVALFSIPLFGQLIDQTMAPNPAGEGIKKSLNEQIGAGRGDLGHVVFFYSVGITGFKAIAFLWKTGRTGTTCFYSYLIIVIVKRIC